jgi:uncharacterized protein (TIGR00725 family)
MADSPETAVLRNRKLIAVIGAGDCSNEQKLLAHEVGRLVAQSGAILVCGGLGGTMQAAAAGAKSAGGLTIGILPGFDKSDADENIDIRLPTGLGEARNMLVVRAADAIVALPGKFGTLTEVSFALLDQIPVVSIGSWEVDPAVHTAITAEEAVALALKLAKARR